jgi:hypothetical protein
MKRALFAVVAVALVAASGAIAAAPNYMFVSGPGLARPVLLANWDENGVLLSSLVNAPFATDRVARGLARRPRFEVSEFWGWGGRPRPVRPAQANQRGWFYPAHGAAPAVFAVMVNGTPRPRLAPRRALRILAHHGIPIHR